MTQQGGELCGSLPLVPSRQTTRYRFYAVAELSSPPTRDSRHASVKPPRRLPSLIHPRPRQDPKDAATALVARGSGSFSVPVSNLPQGRSSLAASRSRRRSGMQFMPYRAAEARG